MKLGRFIKVAGVVMALVVMVVFNTSMGWAEEGVTDDEIKIGTTVDLSGPIAFMGKHLVAGANMYFDYINDRGGVYGRKINLLVEDDGYQAPRAVQAGKKLLNKDKVFCMFLNLGSTQVNALSPILKRKGVPLVCPGTSVRALLIPPRKYIFISDPTYTTQGKIAVEYTVNGLGVKNPKVACIYQDDLPGQDWLLGVSIACKHFGFDVLELPYKRGSVDFSSQIAKCKAAGITHIYMWTLVREPAMILKEAQRVQYKATYFACYASMSSVVLQLAGDAVDYANCLYAVGNVYTLENPDSALTLYTKNNMKYGPKDLDDANYLYGYFQAINLVEGLFRAGPNLTREGFVKALETFDGFYNGINPPVKWGPGLRDGSRAFSIGKAENGKWVVVTPKGEWIYSEIKEY